MADLTGMMQAAAGNAGGIPGGIYIAVGEASNPNASFTGRVTLLNHAAGLVSFASTYNVTPGGVNAVAFSPDSKYLAVAHAGPADAQNFTLFQVDEGTLVRSSSVAIPASASCCAWHPSGEYIAVGNFTTSPQLRILNHSSGSLSLASTYTYGESVTGVDFTSDGGYLMAVSNGTTTQTLFSFSAGTLTRQTTYNTGSGVRACKFSPDDAYVALSDGGGGRVCTLLNHSAGSLSLATTYSAFESNSLDWSPDGSYLVCALETTGNSVLLLNHSAGSLSLAATYALTPTNGNTCKTVAFHPSGEYVAVGTVSSPFFNLLNHSAGTLSFADSYTMAVRVNTVAFNPGPV
jgi:WD40 repeat protein